MSYPSSTQPLIADLIMEQNNVIKSFCKVLHHSNNVAQDNSRVCFCCLSLPYKSWVFLLAARAKNKGAYLKVHVMWSPAHGSPCIPPVTQTALQLLLGCGTWWDRGKHPQPVCPAGAHAASRTWDRSRASQALGKMKRITYKLAKQLKSLTGETGEVQMKKSLAPLMLEPATLPVLAPGLWHFPLLFPSRGLCAWQHAMSTSANRAAMICPTKYLGLS